MWLAGGAKKPHCEISPCPMMNTGWLNSSGTSFPLSLTVEVSFSQPAEGLETVKKTTMGVATRAVIGV